MLAYRHSFHAGNHADVLKHVVQTAVLNYFNEKDKPYWVVDTHAGAGVYSLSSKHAQRNSEHLDGISKLFTKEDLPALLAQYIDLVKHTNSTTTHPDKLTLYPGSPSISAYLIRAGDKLKLYELHSTDFTLLRELFVGQRAISMQHIDGFLGLKASLPPPPRRGLVLIDPSYELKEDYNHVFNAVKDSLLRFASGTYLIWYPIINRQEWWRMVERLERLQVSWLNVSMTIAELDEQGFGMMGSGMFVINPPWVLEAQLREVMPYLVKALGQFSKAGFTLQSHEPRVHGAKKKGPRE
jgi:23S rRNA (adenine2030-N6)-methyltransferase